MNLQPIHFSFVFILISLISFAVSLGKDIDNPKLSLPSIFFLIGYGSFVYFYTDTLIDALLILGLFVISITLLIIPCTRFEKNQKYLILFFFNHLIAAVLLSAVRKLCLISSPFYMTSPIFLYAYIYIVAKSNTILKSLVTTVVCIVVSLILHIDYTLPLTFDMIPDATSIMTSRSKPVIAASNYFRKHHQDERILSTEGIHQDGEIYIFITSTETPKGYFFIYKDGQVTPFDNTF